jgi:dolichol-phosphate mannosyltransferase
LPELLLHFAVPFALAAPILGLKRALIVGVAALLPDLDVFMYLHRSFTHSIVFLSIFAIPLIFASLKLGRGFRTVLACSLSLFSHPLLDLFNSPTPLFYPISTHHYHVSLSMSVLFSDRIIPHFSSSIVVEEAGFKSFHSFDAPIFTDIGFIASLILITTPSMYLTLFRATMNAANHTDGKTFYIDLGNVEGDGMGSETLPTDKAAAYFKDDVTVVIPTLNEEKAIGKVIQEVREQGFKNILVVDGHSSDQTAEIARKAGARVVYQSGHGKGMAVKTGFELAKTPWILVMDGDGTYDPRSIDKMVKVAVERGCDEVIGYRMDRENIPLLHRFGNSVISTLISILMGYRIKDPCSGIYLLRRDFVRQCEIISTGFEVEAEIVCQVIAHGRVAEVPVRYRRRIGEPKLKTWRAGLGIVLTAVKISWLYNPVFLLGSLASLLAVPGIALTLWQLYLRYVYGAGAWSLEVSWLGLFLLVVGMQGFTLTILALMLKRMERRIVQSLKKF